MSLQLFRAAFGADILLIDEASDFVSAFQSPPDIILLLGDLLVGPAEWPTLPIVVRKNLTVQGAASDPRYYPILDLGW